MPDSAAPPPSPDLLTLYQRQPRASTKLPARPQRKLNEPLPEFKQRLDEWIEEQRTMQKRGLDLLAKE